MGKLLKREREESAQSRVDPKNYSNKIDCRRWPVKGLSPGSSFLYNLQFFYAIRSLFFDQMIGRDLDMFGKKALTVEEQDAEFKPRERGPWQRRVKNRFGC